MKENKLVMAPSHSHKKLFRGIPIALNTNGKRSNELWGIDMTYIWCGENGWGYFHGVIDHYDKELLGYHFSQSCSALGGVMALAEAASKRRVERLELRSDNGCHYGAKIFREEIRRLGINHTRTMVNTPKGNAVVERFFRTLKEECVWQHKFNNFEEAKEAVSAWVGRYNSERNTSRLDTIPQCIFTKKVRNPSRWRENTIAYRGALQACHFPSNPPSSPALSRCTSHTPNRKALPFGRAFLFGGGRIRTSEGRAVRFTV